MSSQQFKNESVQLTLSLKENNESTNSYTLSLNVKVASGDHMYAYVPPGKPYMSTSIEHILPDGIEAEGKWQLPASHLYIGDPEIMVYQGDFDFSQKLTIPESNLDAEIAVRFKFQCCNMMSCSMPEDVQLTIKPKQ